MCYNIGDTVRCDMRILIVEDEAELCAAIAEGLELDGYAVDRCFDGEQAYELLSVESYDLAVLDLNLPGMDGMEVLRRVRKANKELKVLILSARDRVGDKVAGLDGGANDYLVKPFAFEELEAHIRCLLRRSFVQEDTVLEWRGISLDTAKRCATAGGEQIPLTRKEFAILEYFMLRPGVVISQEELIEHIWNMYADSFSNSVRVHIASLRKKLKLALGFDPIATRIGQGYCLSEEVRA